MIGYYYIKSKFPMRFTTYFSYNKVLHGNLVSPTTTTDVCPTPSLSLSYDYGNTIPPLPNQIYDLSDDGLDIDAVAPMIEADVDDDPFEVFCNGNDDDDDASLFAGLMNDNDVDIDSSSMIAVDELLSLDRVLGLDSPLLDIDNDWM